MTRAVKLAIIAGVAVGLMGAQARGAPSTAGEAEAPRVERLAAAARLDFRIRIPAFLALRVAVGQAGTDFVLRGNGEVLVAAAPGDAVPGAAGRAKHWSFRRASLDAFPKGAEGRVATGLRTYTAAMP